MSEPPAGAEGLPPRLLGRLFEQFGRPSGLLGRLAGYVMARSEADDRWVVELLDVQPHDRVLEVGFGPGVAVALIVGRATSGFVAGVDPDPSRYGFTDEDEQVAEAVAPLGSVGFRDVTPRRQEIDRQTMLAILTHR